MKKLIIKCVIMVGFFVGVSNFMFYKMTGKNPVQLPDFSLDTSKIEELTNTEQEVYKWVDENGVTQYSSEPPPEHINSESLTLDPNTNIVQAIEVPEVTQTDTPDTPEVALPDGPVYSPESIKQLMDNAKDVQKLLNERNEQQQKLLEEL